MFTGEIAALGLGGKEFPPVFGRELRKRVEFQR
jgi:hypothetical protein